MKVVKFITKLLKYILWLVLVGILLFLLIGYAKFDGGLRDYSMYLNQKDRDEAISQVKIFSISSYGNLFWTGSDGELLSGEGHVLEGSEERSDLLPHDVMSGQDSVNPQLEEDFNKFFDDSSVCEVLITGKANFGFKTGDATCEQESIIGNNEGEGQAELSDNKKDLLRLFGR